MRTFVVVLAIAGCGRVGFDAVGDAQVATADACQLGPFGAWRALTEINSTENDFGGWLSEDGREIVFSSARGGRYELYRATRGSTTAMFGAPVVFPLVASHDVDDPFITDDGLTMYVDYNDPTDYDLWVATRQVPSGPFTLGRKLTELSVTLDYDGGPTLTGDELTIVFNRYVAGVDYELFIATRNSKTDAFGPPQAIASLDTNGLECCAAISADGQRMIYTTDRFTSPNIRLVETTRNGPGFATPVPFEPALAGDRDDVDAHLTRNGRFLLWSSNRTGTMASHDLFLAERACL